MDTVLIAIIRTRIYTDNNGVHLHTCVPVCVYLCAVVVRAYAATERSQLPVVCTARCGAHKLTICPSGKVRVLLERWSQAHCTMRKRSRINHPYPERGKRTRACVYVCVRFERGARSRCWPHLVRFICTLLHTHAFGFVNAIIIVWYTCARRVVSTTTATATADNGIQHECARTDGDFC